MDCAAVVARNLVSLCNLGTNWPLSIAALCDLDHFPPSLISKNFGFNSLLDSLTAVATEG
jgi:hypothetical protein